MKNVIIGTAGPWKDNVNKSAYRKRHRYPRRRKKKGYIYKSWIYIF